MRSFLLAAGVAGCLVALSGCSSDPGPDGLTGSQSESGSVDELMVTAATEGAGETVQMMNPGGAPRLFQGHFPTRVPEGCEFDAAIGRFICDAVERENGPTMQRSYAFLDGTGNSQSAYDAALTDAINFQSTVSGEIARERVTGIVNHQRELTASGLTGEETTWTWNGVGSGSSHEEGEFAPPGRGGAGGGQPGRGGPGGGGPGGGQPGRGNGSGTGAGVPMSIDITSSMAVSNVVVPYPAAAGAWPLSGTITQSMKATIAGGPHDGEVREGTAILTFNGTQFATLTVGDETRTIDLANPPGPPHRGQR